MSQPTMRGTLTQWVADQPDDEVDVAAAVMRGHRAFLRRLLLRCALAVVLAAAPVLGTFAMRPAAVSGHPTPVAVPPATRLQVSPNTGPAPLQVKADASGSTPATGATITSYIFDFGDGSTVGPQPGPAAGHTYKTAGTYAVTVTVTDSDGQTSTDSRTVTVT